MKHQVILLTRKSEGLSGSLLAVNDVVVHPNQGELISCDQAGRIKQWDLSENICTHELVRFLLVLRGAGTDRRMAV